MSKSHLPTIVSQLLITFKSQVTDSSDHRSRPRTKGSGLRPQTPARPSASVSDHRSRSQTTCLGLRPPVSASDHRSRPQATYLGIRPQASASDLRSQVSVSDHRSQPQTTGLDWPGSGQSTRADVFRQARSGSAQGQTRADRNQPAARQNGPHRALGVHTLKGVVLTDRTKTQSQ